MQETTHISLKNRTGMHRSPLQSQELLDATAGQPPVAEPDPLHGGIAETRGEYIATGEVLGTVPAPLTPTGMVKSVTTLLSGNRLQVFMDKLAERAAFERGGVRLYDALLTKHLNGSQAGLSTDDPRRQVSRDVLQKIRNQEWEHFVLVSNCVEKLGGDPTAQTPSADVVGVQAMGLVQTVTEPRTTLTQSLSAILAAELVDVAAWELLIELARALGQDEMIASFEEAHRHEEQHLQVIRGWYTSLVMHDSGNPTAPVTTTIQD